MLSHYLIPSIYVVSSSVSLVHFVMASITLLQSLSTFHGQVLIDNLEIHIVLILHTTFLFPYKNPHYKSPLSTFRLFSLHLILVQGWSKYKLFFFNFIDSIKNTKLYHFLHNLLIWRYVFPANWQFFDSFLEEIKR